MKLLQKLKAQNRRVDLAREAIFSPARFKTRINELRLYLQAIQMLEDQARPVLDPHKDNECIDDLLFERRDRLKHIGIQANVEPIHTIDLDYIQQELLHFHALNSQLIGILDAYYQSNPEST